MSSNGSNAITWAWLVPSMLLSRFGYLGRQRISRYRVMQLGRFSWLDRFSVRAGRMGFGKTWMPACART